MKRLFISLTALLLALCLLTGCGGKAEDPGAYSPYENGFVTSDTAAMESEGFENGYYEDVSADSIDIGQGQNKNLKIIYEAYLRVETLDYESSIGAISDAVKSFDGYIESSEQHGGYRYSSDSYSSRSSSLVIRIPTGHYSEFLGSVGNFGNLLSKNEYTTDITAGYLDVEARLSSLTAQEQRLLELMAEAESIEDLLYIEDTLAEVRYEIESYTSRMRTYDNQLAYSTITLDLQEVRTITPVQQRSFPQRVWDAVKDSARGVVTFLDSLSIALIYALPYLVLLAAVLLLIVKLCKRSAKKRKAKKAAKAAKAEKPAEPQKAAKDTPKE